MQFDGSTYNEALDHDRLNKQYLAVFKIMRDAKPHSLYELATLTGYPMQSISARLRDMRKPRNGSHNVERKRVDKGLFSYRLVPSDLR